jgi:hypothetical protein
MLFLAASLALTIAFFRKRMIALVITGLGFILVNAGVTAIFHPSFVGICLTVGSAALLYLAVRWHARRFPGLGAKDWKKIFENGPNS